MSKTIQQTLPPTPWRETSLFKNLKEVTEEGYKQMLEYEKAGGELTLIDKSAKKYFERYYRRHKQRKSKDSEIEVNGDIDVNDSWDD